MEFATESYYPMKLPLPPSTGFKYVNNSNLVKTRQTADPEGVAHW